MSPLGRLEADRLTVVAPVIGSPRIMVQEGDEGIHPIALPALPLFWGKELLVPGEDGRIYLVDPRAGLVRAEQFVPPFDRDRLTHWRTPIRLDDEAVALADLSGRVRRLTRTSAEAGGRLIADNLVDLGSLLAADPAATGEALVLTTIDGKVRILAGRDLSASRAGTLDAGMRFDPVGAAGFVFVGDAEGRVFAFGPGGRRVWTIDPDGATPVGAPVVIDGVAWFPGGNGWLQGRSPADGALLDRIDPGTLPAGDPLAVGSEPALLRLRGPCGCVPDLTGLLRSSLSRRWR